MLILEARADTVLKKRPEQSTLLNDSEKINFFQGAKYKIESYIPEEDHLKVTLMEAIVGEKIWYAFPERVAIYDDQLPLDNIVKLVKKYKIAHYKWLNRGVAPAGYIKGMALVYNQIYRKLKAQDPIALEMAQAETENPEKDALAHYAQKFKELGMDNSSTGVDTLRHLFVLLIGLGMRESSGRYCEGRDRSADNTTEETAEAGLFQTSYNARKGHPLMPKVFEQYLANPSGFLEVFQEGVTPKSSDLPSLGKGKGYQFQELSKTCPAFAAEFTALGLRNIRKHWGPINRQEVEIRPECDDLLKQIQKIVDELNQD